MFRVAAHSPFHSIPLELELSWALSSTVGNLRIPALTCKEASGSVLEISMTLIRPSSRVSVRVLRFEQRYKQAMRGVLRKEQLRSRE